jgi:GNAT superfamily N-acetyltransferase
MNAGDLRQISLTPDHIPGGLALSQEAGWNQVAEDWAFMLGAGQAFGLLEGSGDLVASGLTIECPDYAWVSMILVTACWRRQGLASRLMGACLDALAARGLTPGLDASPDGREVYLRLGFRDVALLTRLAVDLRGLPSAEGLVVRPIQDGDIPDIIALDARSSGTNRDAILTFLRSRRPDLALVVKQAGTLRGFALARPGRLMPQLGPIVADSDEVAAALLASAGSVAGGPVILDLFDERAAIRGLLDRAGAVQRTRYIRMVRGQKNVLPERHQTYAVAGPELG